MDRIRQIPFNFDPRIGMVVGLMVGFLVFAVSWDNATTVIPEG